MPKQQLDIKSTPYRPTDAQGRERSGLASEKRGDFANVIPLHPTTELRSQQGSNAQALGNKAAVKPRRPLYTPEQRAIRDKTPWTMVQAILAPLQFLVFAISLGLVARYLLTGQGYEIATASIVAKTIILYVIMITGSIWEKVVFDEWLFVESFFWEDVFSMLVLGLQTLYLAALIFGWWTPNVQMGIALAAYTTYVVNAAQFVWKLRMARLESALPASPSEAVA